MRAVNSLPNAPARTLQGAIMEQRWAPWVMPACDTTDPEGFCTLCDIWSPRSIRLLPFLTLAAVGLTACGSGNSGSTAGENTAEASSNEVVNRAAGSDDTSCPEQSSLTFEGQIINGLPVPVTLSVPRNSWICENWSGVSTPGRAFNGNKVVQAGERHPFLLEVHDRDKGNFTLGSKAIGYEGVDQVVMEGETRLYVRGELQPGEGVQQEPWLGSTDCSFVPIATAPREWKGSWRDTARYEVFEAFSRLDLTRLDPNAVTMFVVYQGRIGLVFYNSYLRVAEDTFCGIPKG
jgi:hypothetical protein